MKQINIDIETFSSEPLAKCGVYKYAESPDFEILLFGYAVDGGEVQVVDLTAGERIPKEIINALTDDSMPSPLHRRWILSARPQSAWRVNPFRRPVRTAILSVVQESWGYPNRSDPAPF